MPFVDKDHRENPDENTAGDRCYLHYRWMVDKWRDDPRWNTASNIYAEVVDLNQPSLEWQQAKELAWQVFFNLHVMPYELKKQKENGDI